MDDVHTLLLVLTFVMPDIWIIDIKILTIARIIFDTFNVNYDLDIFQHMAWYGHLKYIEESIKKIYEIPTERRLFKLQNWL